MGQLFATTLEVDLAATSLGAGIDIDLRVAPKTECFTKCMIEFDYHLYTGGWGFGRDPSTLYFLYLSDDAQAYAYTANYPGYVSPEFDIEAIGMLTAGEIGDPETEGTAKYHVYRMQEILMDDVGIIPIFTYASYSAMLIGWENMVNTAGAGLGTWGSFYTQMNTFKEGESLLRWAFMNDIEGTNTMHAEWVWDSQLLGFIYDSCIGVDPYDVTHDLDAMALSWILGEWDYEGEPCSYIEFHIREDMQWHDVAPKADRVTPGGAPLLPDGAFDVPVTAEDVAFSIIATKTIEDAWDNDLVSDVVYVDVLDLYTIKIYYGVYMPLWALHWCGGLPIFPKHVWGPVFEERNTREFDTLAQECLVGCGPFTFDYAASTIHEYYRLVANEKFYGYHPIDVYGVVADHTMEPGTEASVTFYLRARDSQGTAAGTMNVDIEIEYPDGTTETLYSAANPDLAFDVPVEIYTYTSTIDIGKYVLRASIDDDPVTGHSDILGYSVTIWCTIEEDLNLDFQVTIKDIFIAAKAFGSEPGHIRWDPKPDINNDFKINIGDLFWVAKKFGWP